MKYPLRQQFLAVDGRLSPSRLLWPFLAALLAGIVLAVLPLEVGGLVVVGTAVLLLVFIQPMFGLLLALLIGPFGAVESFLTGGSLLDSGQITLFITLAAWLARSISRRRIILPQTPLNLPILAFIGLTSVTGLYAISSLFWLKEVVKWVEILLVMWLVVDLVMEQGQTADNGPASRRPAGSRSVIGRLAAVRGMVFMLLLAGLSQALIGIWQFGLRGDGPEHFEIPGGFYRAYGTFEQPNPFGGFMSMAACLAVGVLVGLVMDWFRKSGVSQWISKSGIMPGQKGRSCLSGGSGGAESNRDQTGTLLLWVLFVGGSTAALVAGLVFSWSRGAWLGFSAAVAALVMFFPRRRRIGLLLLLAGGILFLTGNRLGLIPASISARVSSFQEDLQFGDVRGVDINDANYAVLERLAHWQAALDMARDNLWTGVGFGNYEPAYGNYALINWPYPLGHSHNYYLNILAETGILGLAAYLVLWGIIIRQAVGLVGQLDWPRRGIALGLLALWITFSVHHLVDKLYVNNLYLFLGAVLGLQQIIGKKNDSFSG